MLLAGKTAVISGGAGERGIGFCTARTFAEHGARVAILDLDAEASRKAAASLGPEHIGLACNVARRADCDRAVQAAIEAFGHLDIVIANAGITQGVKVWDIVDEDWNRILDVNLAGVFHLAQAAMPHMRGRKQGSIACMSSVSAQRGGGILGGAHYSAAKAGVLGLAKAMARDLGPDGIRVNCVAPGLIRTDIQKGKLNEEQFEAIRAGVPIGRLGAPQDVANAYLYLASDLSSYVTGAVIDVNGGMHIH
jgi:NAD(P)-dependent dehydrogenase (short-subunit alcohol dehydrogenase family)